MRRQSKSKIDARLSFCRYYQKYQPPTTTALNHYLRPLPARPRQACNDCLCNMPACAGPETLLLLQQEENRVDERPYVDDYDEPLPKWSTHQARTSLPML